MDKAKILNAVNAVNGFGTTIHQHKKLYFKGTELEFKGRDSPGVCSIAIVDT
jgi:hypothetical protein